MRRDKINSIEPQAFQSELSSQWRTGSSAELDLSVGKSSDSWNNTFKSDLLLSCTFAAKLTGQICDINSCALTHKQSGQKKNKVAVGSEKTASLSGEFNILGQTFTQTKI